MKQEDIKKLEEGINQLLKERNDLEFENEQLKKWVEFLEKRLHKHIMFKLGVTPVQVYHCKTRGNTTVKFLDGKSVTVHKMKGDKDCIETAIAYALAKHYISSSGIKRLVKNLKEVD